MLSFGIEKEGTSGTNILGADAAGDDGTLSAVNNAPSSPSPSPPHWPCPLLLLPSPADVVDDKDVQKTSFFPRQRHHRHDRHRRTTAVASKDDGSHFNAAFAAAVDIAAATAVAAAVTIAFTAAIAIILALSAAITIVVIAATAAATATAAAADAATTATAPSPLPLLSLSLQPLPMSLHL